MDYKTHHLISDYNLLSDEMFLKLNHSWNNTVVEFDRSAAIHTLFEKQVSKTPDHIALVYENVRLSYRSLNEKANQLAHYLIEKYNVQSNDLIPLCLERSEKMFIGILDVLKAGGAYVPMESSYPRGMVTQII